MQANQEIDVGWSIAVGGTPIKSWSSTQGVIALSSGEAEYYALVKGGSIGLGIQSIMQDLGVQASVVMFTDSSAALGTASRMGLGEGHTH